MSRAFSPQVKPRHEFWKNNVLCSKLSFRGDLTRLVSNSGWLFRVDLIHGLELALLEKTSPLKYSVSYYHHPPPRPRGEAASTISVSMTMQYF